MGDRPRADRKRDNGGFAHIIVLVAVVAIVIIAALAWSYEASKQNSSSNPPDGSNNNGSNGSSNNVTLSQGQASAQVIVTIHSTHSIFSVHYVLYLNSDQKASGDIAAHSSIIQTIQLVFPENQTGLYSVVILANSSGGGFGDMSDQAVVTPVNGGTYPVTLNI